MSVSSLQKFIGLIWENISRSEILPLELRELVILSSYIYDIGKISKHNM